MRGASTHATCVSLYVPFEDEPRAAGHECTVPWGYSRWSQSSVKRLQKSGDAGLAGGVGAARLPAMRVTAGLLFVAALALAGCSGALEDAAEAATTTPSTTVQADSTTTTAAPATTSSLPTTTSTTTSTTAPPTTTTTTPLAPITLAFAGDTSFTHGLADRDPLGDVVAELSGPDLAIVNLETTVAEADVGRAIQKRFVFKSPPKTADILAEAGVDIAALANNHALDYGPEAVVRTIEILDEGGIVTAGTGIDPESAYAGVRVDVEGWDVAILSFSRVPCDSPEPGESYIEEVAWACPEFEHATIDAVAAAADADLVVVMIHWGVQSRGCPEPHQHDLAAKWIAHGADVVVGSHPHVLQGVEQIDGAWVIHSTGNFAFPSARNASSYTALFLLEVTPDGADLSVEPMRIRGGRPVVATSSRAGILDLLSERSFGFVFDGDGQAVPTESVGRC